MRIKYLILSWIMRRGESIFIICLQTPGMHTVSLFFLVLVIPGLMIIPLSADDQNIHPKQRIFDH